MAYVILFALPPIWCPKYPDIPYVSDIAALDVVRTTVVRLRRSVSVAGVESLVGMRLPFTLLLMPSFGEYGRVPLGTSDDMRGGLHRE